MKKFLSLLVLAVAASSASAQITGLDMPSPGTHIKYQEINKNGLDVYQTLNGQGQVWDYRSILEKTDTTVLDYIDPNTTSAIDSFPGSTVAESITGTNGYFYYKLTSDGFYRQGFYDQGQDIGMPYNDNLKLYTFPLTFGSSVSDSYTCTNGWFTSYPAIIDDGTYTADVTGKGILRVPTGYFNDVFRIYYEEVFTIKADVGLGSYMGLVKIEEFGYEYWKAGHVKPLMVYVSSTTNDLFQGGATTTIGVRYDKTATPDGQNPTSIAINNSNDISFSTISSNIFSLNALESMENCDITVYDLLGNKIFSSVINNNTTKYYFQLQNVASGVYVVKVNGLKTSYTHKFNVL